MEGASSSTPSGNRCLGDHDSSLLLKEMMEQYDSTKWESLNQLVLEREWKWKNCCNVKVTPEEWPLLAKIINGNKHKASSSSKTSNVDSISEPVASSSPPFGIQTSGLKTAENVEVDLIVSDSEPELDLESETFLRNVNFDKPDSEANLSSGQKMPGSPAEIIQLSSGEEDDEEVSFSWESNSSSVSSENVPDRGSTDQEPPAGKTGSEDKTQDGFVDMPVLPICAPGNEATGPAKDPAKWQLHGRQLIRPAKLILKAPSDNEQPPPMLTPQAEFSTVATADGCTNALASTANQLTSGDLIDLSLDADKLAAENVEATASTNLAVPTGNLSNCAVGNEPVDNTEESPPPLQNGGTQTANLVPTSEMEPMDVDQDSEMGNMDTHSILEENNAPVSITRETTPVPVVPVSDSNEAENLAETGFENTEKSPLLESRKNTPTTEIEQIASQQQGTFPTTAAAVATTQQTSGSTGIGFTTDDFTRGKEIKAAESSGAAQKGKGVHQPTTKCIPSAKTRTKKRKCGGCLKTFSPHGLVLHQNTRKCGISTQPANLSLAPPDNDQPPPQVELSVADATPTTSGCNGALNSVTAGDLIDVSLDDNMTAKIVQGVASTNLGAIQCNQAQTSDTDQQLNSGENSQQKDDADDDTGNQNNLGGPKIRNRGKPARRQNLGVHGTRFGSKRRLRKTGRVDVTTTNGKTRGKQVKAAGTSGGAQKRKTNYRSTCSKCGKMVTTWYLRNHQESGNCSRVPTGKLPKIICNRCGDAVVDVYLRTHQLTRKCILNAKTKTNVATSDSKPKPEVANKVEKMNVDPKSEKKGERTCVKARKAKKPGKNFKDFSAEKRKMKRCRGCFQKFLPNGLVLHLKSGKCGGIPEETGPKPGTSRNANLEQAELQPVQADSETEPEESVDQDTPPETEDEEEFKEKRRIVECGRCHRVFLPNGLALHHRSGKCGISKSTEPTPGCSRNAYLEQAEMYSEWEEDTETESEEEAAGKETSNACKYADCFVLYCPGFNKEAHQKVHRKHGVITLKCRHPSCGKKFMHLLSLKLHLEKEHSKST